MWGGTRERERWFKDCRTYALWLPQWGRGALRLYISFLMFVRVLDYHAGGDIRSAARTGPSTQTVSDWLSIQQRSKLQLSVNQKLKRWWWWWRSRSDPSKNNQKRFSLNFNFYCESRRGVFLFCARGFSGRCCALTCASLLHNLRHFISIHNTLLCCCCFFLTSAICNLLPN